MEQSIGFEWGLSRRNVVGYRIVCVWEVAAKTLHTFNSSFYDTHSHYNMPKPSNITFRACERCRGNEVGCVVLNCRLLVDDVNFSMLRLTTASSLVNMEDDKVS
jgi:hypothetical protein